MSDSRAKQLKEDGDRLFGQVTQLRAFQQDVAENFYPERAQFCAGASTGFDFASHLTSGVPLLARRELGDAFSAMMRPSTPWFFMGTDQEEFEDRAGKLWLEEKTKVQRRALYDRASNFVRVTKAADHDFAAFGQAVMSCDLNEYQNGLEFELYHLRDVVWREGRGGQIVEIHRQWNAPACDLYKKFKGKVHQKVAQCLEPGKDKYQVIRVRHAIVRAEDYKMERKTNHPWVSVWYDCDNEFILEEIGRPDEYYIIPRWKLLDSSQYAFSPSVIVALPEARLIQVQALTLMEAGEKAVDPAMVGRAEVIRGDVNTFRGGITWVDGEYDGELKDVLSTIELDHRGLPVGMEMMARTEKMIAQAFYLNRLTSVPQGGPDMTAYQVGQMVQDYIRNALPLFEPMEDEFNAQICERAFGVLLRGGAFGPMDEIPESLSGAKIKWKFKSPLHDAVETSKRAQLREAVEDIAIAEELEPGSKNIINARVAIRDVLNARTPQTWLRGEEELQQMDEQDQQNAQAAQMMQGVQAAAATAEQAGKAGKALNEAEGQA